ncbi:MULTISPECIES: hypothetical protein [unclassified Moorena]|uniref:hypothetical protein n=1 Tax=unclassified Moorena TaxID=2683338 RepID=UPI0025FF0E38|nr:MULTISPECIES: hypothetical protein [unclassified Moorena]
MAKAGGRLVRHLPLGPRVPLVICGRWLKTGIIQNLPLLELISKGSLKKWTTTVVVEVDYYLDFLWHFSTSRLPKYAGVRVVRIAWFIYQRVRFLW